jgi:hypothetical protein
MPSIASPTAGWNALQRAGSHDGSGRLRPDRDRILGSARGGAAGSPADIILRVAREVHPSLIVLGLRQRSWLAKRALDSTARSVALSGSPAGGDRFRHRPTTNHPQMSKRHRCAARDRPHHGHRTREAGITDMNIVSAPMLQRHRCSPSHRGQVALRRRSGSAAGRQ